MHVISVAFQLAPRACHGEYVNSPPALGQVGREVADMGGNAPIGGRVVAEQQDATARGHGVVRRRSVS